jgi:hypothetical protein
LQKLFEDVYSGNMRLGGSEVFTFDGLVDFVAVDRYIARRPDADFHASGADAEYRDFYIIAYDEAFIILSRKYQHPCRYLRGIPCPAVKGT